MGIVSETLSSAVTAGLFLGVKIRTISSTSTAGLSSTGVAIPVVDAIAASLRALCPREIFRARPDLGRLGEKLDRGPGGAPIAPGGEGVATRPRPGRRACGSAR